MYSDKFQKKLTSPLEKIFKKIPKKIPKKVIEQINIDDKNNVGASKMYSVSLVDFTICDGKIKIDKKIHDGFLKKRDNRVDYIKNLLLGTIAWCRKNKLIVPNTTIYIYISDRAPFYSNTTNLPIFCMAAPKSFGLPLFPDNSFNCMTFDEKYSTKCYDWDATKKLVVSRCSKIPPKQNIIYFKGVSTTRRHNRIREDLEDFSKDKDFINVSLDAWTNYEPLYKWCKYLFLLNLPGLRPWSNRLRNLFLMKSIVINVNVNTIYDTYEDKDIISFQDYVLTKGVDYINIDVSYYVKKYDPKFVEKNKKEKVKMLAKIENVYKNYAKNKSKYDAMVENSYNKITTLSNERIYDYIYRCLVLNSKIHFT